MAVVVVEELPTENAFVRTSPTEPAPSWRIVSKEGERLDVSYDADGEVWAGTLALPDRVLFAGRQPTLLSLLQALVRAEEEVRQL